MEEWKSEIYQAALAAKEEQKTVKAIQKTMALAGFVEDFQSFRHDLNIAMHQQGYSCEREFLKIWRKQLKSLQTQFGKN